MAPVGGEGAVAAGQAPAASGRPRHGRRPPRSAGETLGRPGREDRRALAKARAEIEARLLVQSDEVHTERGRHASVRASVIDREPRSATVVAEEPTELLAIAQEDFYELLADHPEIAGAVLRVMSRRLRQANSGTAEEPG